MKYSSVEGVLRLPRFFSTEKKMNKKAMELLEVFGLENEASTLADNLPYGKQRKLEIARALATNPKLLLLDEPAAGMNPQETAELMDTIRLIRDKFDITILLSSNIGVMNLLPLPALDGGRLLFMVIEVIRRKKMKPEVEGMVHAIGLILLLILMAVVSWNDIKNIFGL